MGNQSFLIKLMKKLLLFFISIILLSSCHITKELDVVGGSKADAIVEMTYEYHLFQKVTISSWEESQEKATNTCRAWGYTSAKRFETPKKDCIGWGKDGCHKWRVTWQYQCLE